MDSLSLLPARLARRLLGSMQGAMAGIRYRHRVRRGKATGSLRYVPAQWRDPGRASVEVRLPGNSPVTADEAVSWCRDQTLAGLQVVCDRPEVRTAWRVDGRGPVPTSGSDRPATTWFLAPGCLPSLDPVQLESAFLVAAAEAVDAVALAVDGSPVAVDGVGDPGEVLRDPLRQITLLWAPSYHYDPASDQIRPLRRDQLVKILDSHRAVLGEDDPRCWNRRRRGPYLSSSDLGPTLKVGVRDVAALEREPARTSRPGLVVLAPFLARGGAEQTLFATLEQLSARLDIAIATLAPHRPSLGDRRSDFTTITPRLFSLGDLVHPAAMPGILCSMLDALQADVLYNANGTTLFYEFAPLLKSHRPHLRIVDHLYDHRVGYIDRYGPALLASVDACVAENHLISEALIHEREWPAERAPVIWPCGRPQEDWPALDQISAVRLEVRRELGLDEDDLLILTAARMHAQKRPLDLVALARRVIDLECVHFLVVGGGDLEQEVDEAIAGVHGARIRRLAFRDDIPRLITAADLGCLVSDHEGLPVFLIECLQAGKPFLGTDVGDLGRVLRQTGAGIVVDRPGDLDALEAAVRRLVDPDLRAELGARATAAADLFDVEGCAARYLEVLMGRPVSTGAET